jgi:hypothetical protein
MGKNLDLKNIFESYYNNVVLGEAVKPVEVDSAPKQLTPEQQSAVQNIMNTKGYDKARAEMMVLRGQDVKNAAATQQAAQPTQATTQPSTQTVNSITQPTQPAQETDELGNDEGEVVSQEVIGSRPAYTATNGTENFDGTTVTSGPVVASDEEFEQNEEEDADGWTEVGEPEVENVTDEYETEETPAQHGSVKLEKNNISKFLKHLSEKNYSSAHKYLKAILEYKVKNNISKRINKI